jgi:threonine/homoserine/homoserine lactone efflux protein
MMASNESTATSESEPLSVNIPLARLRRRLQADPRYSRWTESTFAGVLIGPTLSLETRLHG